MSNGSGQMASVNVNYISRRIRRIAQSVVQFDDRLTTGNNFRVVRNVYDTGIDSMRIRLDITEYGVHGISIKVGRDLIENE